MQPGNLLFLFFFTVYLSAPSVHQNEMCFIFSGEFRSIVALFPSHPNGKMCPSQHEFNLTGY